MAQQQQQLTSVGPTTPCVMPVYPGRGSTGGNGISGAPAHLITHGGPTAAAAPYSPYSPSRFHIDKPVSSMRSGIQGTGCILVEDAKAVSLDEDPSRELTSSQVPTEESMPTSTAAARGVGSIGGAGGGSGPGGGGGSGASPPAGGPLLGGEQWPILEMREIGRYYSSQIPPFSFWNSEFRNKQPAFIRFNFTLPWGANFAVYGRRNVAPSVTQYDFVEFIKGGRIDRLKRDAKYDEDAATFVAHPVTFTTQKWHSSSQGSGVHVIAPPLIVYRDQLVPVEEVTTTLTPEEHHRKPRSASSGPSHLGLSTGSMVNVTLLQYLDTGRWFLSIYNDDSRHQEVNLAVVEAEGVSTSCPNDCSGHGSCYLGKCDCIDGFEGADCSKKGWKGAECDVPEHDCETPDCSSHGQCLGGVCVCHPGWKGNFCEQVDCADPTCSQHGSCVAGRCYCKAGWQGVNCSVLDQQVYQCLPGCSEHGSYDLESGACRCVVWTVDHMAVVTKESVNANQDGRETVAIYYHATRDVLTMGNARMAPVSVPKAGMVDTAHYEGMTSRDITAGCKSACNNHGTCAMADGEYRCECDGWAGADCSIRLEHECSDDIDNDEDGMVDCSDSECCSHPACSDHIMCLASNDPVEVLLRKQPPSVTASFYQRVKFLIEENSVQSYAHMDEYTERRVAVIRGRVVTPQGLGIIGIRVSVDRDNRFGFTLTRTGGW
ncbi:hypothetical protein B566_EDAN006162 [Ephemera danica]|nr:hypothetical protein B566_EDAN006162 [Ephemera danica]